MPLPESEIVEGGVYEGGRLGQRIAILSVRVVPGRFEAMRICTFAKEHWPDTIQPEPADYEIDVTSVARWAAKRIA